MVYLTVSQTIHVFFRLSFVIVTIITSRIDFNFHLYNKTVCTVNTIFLVNLG